MQQEAGIDEMVLFNGRSTLLSHAQHKLVA